MNKSEIVFNNDLCDQKECGSHCSFKFKIFKLKIMFSSYQMTTLFEESQNYGDYLKAFAMDPKSMILIMMYKSDKDRHNNTRRFKFLDVVDSNKVLANIQVKNLEIIGRMRLGLYTISDGHFYFDNEVIKIRYDVLRQP